MYTLMTPAVSYQDPWHWSFSSRLQSLRNPKLHRVVYLYDRLDNSTFRYRVYNMCTTLRDSGEYYSTFFLTPEIPALRGVDFRNTTFIVSRAQYTGAIDDFVSYQKAAGNRVLFDIDDLICDPKYITLILDTLDQDLSNNDTLNYWFAYCTRLMNTARLCDAVVTTNDHLRICLEQQFDIPGYVVPNFLNAQQIEYSRCLFDEKASSNFKRDDHFHIGYFSGSPSHNKDFQIVETTLDGIMSENSNIRITIVGFLSINSTILRHRDRIEFRSLMDFVNLQGAIASCELNIVPLQNNIFTNAKSELKFFESAIVGTCTVASPIHSYLSCIDDGVNGYIAQNDDWDGVLRHAINSVESLPDMARKARNDSLSRYAPSEQMSALRGIFSHS